MKNNDFEFIKNKFDKVEPEIPYSMDSKFIAEMILNKQEHRVIKFEKKGTNFKSIASAAACFVLIMGIAFAANPNIINNNKAATFENYGDLNSKISTLEKISDSSGKGCGEFKTVKHIAENGVEEPNIIKASDNYIYYAYYDHNNTENRNKVYIYITDNGKSELVSIINNFISDDFSIEDLLVNENRLVITASTESKTIIKIYDVNDKANPILISEFEQSGKYSDSRMIDKTLYIVTNYNVPANDNNNSLPYIKQNDETTFASTKDISYFDNVSIAQYAVINTIDIETGKQSKDLKAVLGGSANIHCTKSYMYINEYIEDEDFSKSENGVAVTMKLNLNNNKISYATKKEVSKYSNFGVDIGKGNNYSSILYSAGEYLLSIGENADTAEEEIILFDKKLNQLDIKTFTNAHITTTLGSLARNDEKNVYAIPAYFTDDSQRYYGVITFELKDNQIVITNEFKNNDNNLMYQGNCIIVGDYLYSFNINDSAPDNSKLKVFAYKY